MCDQTMEYKGYQVVLKPSCPSGSMWYGGYDILKDGRMIASRANIYPGFFYFKAACTDSIEHAKIEIDNLASGTSNIIG
jgi:hypothetical protein